MSGTLWKGPVVRGAACGVFSVLKGPCACSEPVNRRWSSAHPEDGRHNLEALRAVLVAGGPVCEGVDPELPCQLKDVGVGAPVAVDANLHTSAAGQAAIST